MKILKKHDICKLLGAAAKKYIIIAPKEKHGGDILFEETEPVDALPENYVLPYNSLKDFFFPQSEILIPGKNINKKFLFFGVRPCDANAVKFQDLFFSKEPYDIYYLKKRQNSIIITLTCNTPAKNCFCLLSGSGPCLDEKFDLQFTDLGEEFLVTAGNAKGREFIREFGDYFTGANNAQIAEQNTIRNKCKMQMNKIYDMKKIEKKLTEENPAQFWKELGHRCINCGGCEFICPTCFCFNVHDDVSAKSIMRKRSWDSCTFEGYGRMAGGFNPNFAREQRIKRRFYCKLYHSKKWFNMYGCVGCGRCTGVCPVNLEMESFIYSLTVGDNYQSLLKEI